MQHFFYVARDLDLVPVAALGIAVGPGRLDTTSCKWALLLPHRPSAPRLHELVGPSCAGEELRMLALSRAVCDARSGERLILARDFKAAPWEALVHWTGDGRATPEALVAVMEHLGNDGAIPRLRRPGAPNQLDQQAVHS